MKIGIIGSPTRIESSWLEEEAKRRGHEVLRFSVNDVYFKLEDNKFDTVSPHDFKTFDIFLVRGLYRSYQIGDKHFNKATEGLLLLKYLNDALKKPIVDEVLVKKPTILSKMHTAFILSKSSLPHPLTFQFNTKDNVLKNVDKISYPVIVKDAGGWKGENIYKINTKEELERFLDTMPDFIPFLFQEYLPCDGDIRVLVVGYKAIGAMKRFLVPGDFRANISQGARAEKFELSDKIVKIAEEAAKCVEIEVAGVDLIESGGRFYVIEVNRAPQFKGFRKYTKIDPSKFIIQYLEEKAKGKR